MARNPFDALEGPAQPMFVRGEIVDVNLIPGTKSPTFTFTVRPVEGGVGNGDRGGVLSNVIMLQSVFGNLADPANPPTGALGVPSVGSRVLCVFDGFRWCIIGCYTGPVLTATETGNDPDGAQISYNPGIEHVVPRSVGPQDYDHLPGWSQQLEPGDLLLGKGDARVKVISAGALIGGSQNCYALYKKDGSRVERIAEDEIRKLGFWGVHTYGVGTPELLAAVTGPVKDVPGSFVYSCEIEETSLYTSQMTPYHVRQRGHVSPSFLSLGRSSTQAGLQPHAVIKELVTGYFVIRDAVIRPLTPAPPTQIGLEDKAQATLYDFRVADDGSFSLRSGNLAKTPTAGPDLQDFSLSYDAVTGAFKLRVGPSGTPAATVMVSGRTPATSTIEATAGSISATAALSIEATAGKSVTAKAATIEANAAISATIKAGVSLTAECGASKLAMTPGSLDLTAPVINLNGQINLNGPIAAGAAGAPPLMSAAAGVVHVFGALQVDGVTNAAAVTAASVTAAGVGLSSHTHPYINVATPSTTSPPTPG